MNYVKKSMLIVKMCFVLIDNIIMINKLYLIHSIK